MAQLAPNRPPEDAHDLLRRNIQKTVGIATLRRLRSIVDAYEKQDRADNRSNRRMLLAAALIAGCLAVIVVFSGAALPRLLTAVLAWFR
jgi:hypothetical protein